MNMMFPMDPEEARAAIRHEQMKQTLHMHTFFGMLDKMTADELTALASILEGCMASKVVAPQIYGQVKTVLRLKHGACPCGNDCDGEFDVDGADDALAKMTRIPVAEHADLLYPDRPLGDVDLFDPDKMAVEESDDKNDCDN